MPIELLMPALSPTMTEGNLIKWYKKEGDSIKAGEVLAEIETDKATMEVEAVDEGTLGKILIQAGSENVKVNALIALILEEDEDPKSLDSYVKTPAASQPVSTATATPDVVAAPQVKTVQSNDKSRVFASPLAKRLAQNNQVSLESISGSGPKGRIIKIDVEAALTKAPVARSGEYTEISLNNMRKVIAKRLTESKQQIPHFYLNIDCNLDMLLQLRISLNTRNKNGVKISVNDFVIKACAEALIQVPEANAAWHDTVIRQYHSADVAVAVAIDGGLVTPILRSAETKSITALSTEIKALAEKARAGKLVPEEYQGGTFTLSNLGMFGITNFSAILNPPQACILAVGAGEKRPIVKDNQITIATMMTCTLSVDHRAVDGAVGARFLSVFKSLIEDPLSLLV
jgi:pyruvate dehydrogenase E2 component (dihydrolipoamide acetyltransferase)